MGIIADLENQTTFTELEKELSNYILEHLNDIPQLTISQLAQQSFTSNATVNRLCKKLGVAGYKAFRIALAAELEKQRFSKSHVDFDNPFSMSENTANIFKNVASISKEAIDICYASVSQGLVAKAAQQIAKAKRVYIFATGDSYLVGLSFSNMLVKLGIQAIMVNQFHDSIAVIYHSNKDDVILFLSYSGNILNTYAQELELIQARHGKTILISSKVFRDKIDLNITFPAKESIVNKAGGYYSQTAMHYILNCLYSLLYTSNYFTNRKQKNAIENLAKKDLQ